MTVDALAANRVTCKLLRCSFHFRSAFDLDLPPDDPPSRRDSADTDRHSAMRRVDEVGQLGRIGLLL